MCVVSFSSQQQTGIIYRIKQQLLQREVCGVEFVSSSTVPRARCTVVLSCWQM